METQQTVIAQPVTPSVPALDCPASAIPVCTLVHVHPSLLDHVLNDLRDRTDSTYREFFDRLVSDIRQRGVQVPLIAIRRGSRFEVVDGETRLLAALLAGSKSVPVLASALELSESEKKLAALQANAMRLDMTDMQYARVYLHLMEENGWGQAELARRVNAKPAIVSKRLAVFAKFPEDLKSAIGEGDGMIPFTSAYQLARLRDEAMIRDLAEMVRKGLLCRDSVAEEVAKRLGKAPKKAKSIKAKTANGILAMLPLMEFDMVLADLASLVEAIKKCRHHGLPLAAVPGLLKS